MVKSPQTLTFEKLDTLTGLGLTDRRYRQLAKEGCYPPPVDGNYEWVPAIRGLLKYYRDKQTDLKAVKQSIADEQHRKLKRENDLLAREVVRRSEVLGQLARDHDEIKKTLDALEKELPLAIAGMDVATARIVCGRWRDRIEQNYLALVLRWKI